MVCTDYLVEYERLVAVLLFDCFVVLVLVTLRLWVAICFVFAICALVVVCCFS